MNSMPKIIGDFMETAFSSKICKVSVRSVEMLSSNIKIITFKGLFPHVNFKIGQAVVLRIDETNYRNYTPSKWESINGTFQIIFHIHNNGPGSERIKNLKPGDQISVGLPRGFKVYDTEAKYHFFFGDETCISVFKSMKDEINRSGKDYLGILELDSINAAVPEKLGLMVDVVSKSVNKAASAIKAFQNLDPEIWNLWKEGYFYLMGNAKSIQAFRKVLKEKGISNKNIHTQAYWAEGKIGL
jgi:NADPH-dependent ferric siderophore reductase